MFLNKFSQLIDFYMVTTIKLLIDFNSPCYYDVLTYKKGASYEHGKNYFLSSDGIPASLRIPQMRSRLSRRLQDTKFFMYGSIFKHGFRATDISAKVYAISNRAYALCAQNFIIWAFA